MLEMSDFYHYKEVLMKVLFKYVTLSGGSEDILIGTMSQLVVGQMKQLKLCADNWTYHTQVRLRNTIMDALTYFFFKFDTAAQSFSVRLYSKDYQVTGLAGCNKCNERLSQCLPQTYGWHVEISPKVAALSCCKIHSDFSLCR